MFGAFLIIILTNVLGTKPSCWSSIGNMEPKQRVEDGKEQRGALDDCSSIYSRQIYSGTADRLHGILPSTFPYIHSERLAL